MGAALGIAALVVSVAAAVFTFLAWRAADRSADAAEESAVAAGRSAAAAESADRRERQPHLSIVLDYPQPAPGDRVIYRVRNDGPQDLDSLLIYRPQPTDRVIYGLALTGDAAGWAADEIELGAIAVTKEGRFTLSCGPAIDLPEFRVRIVCRAGPDEWLLSHVLPPPRGEPLAEDERASREQLLASALDEVERNIVTLQGQQWHVIPLPDDSLTAAHRLLREHAPDWIGPTRDALAGLVEFKAWRERMGSPTEDQVRQRRETLLSLLSNALAEIGKMRAALKARQASGRAWSS